MDEARCPGCENTREYEWYDHNSLIADEPELRALVPDLMDRAFDLPSRAEMEAGIAAPRRGRSSTCVTAALGSRRGTTASGSCSRRRTVNSAAGLSCLHSA